MLPLQVRRLQAALLLHRRSVPALALPASMARACRPVWTPSSLDRTIPKST